VTTARQRAAVAVAGGAITAVRLRRRLGLPPGVSTALCFTPAGAVLSRFPPSRARDAVVWTAQMLGYKTAFELPNDDPDRLRERAHVDAVLRLDRLIGLGKPPGQRLQRWLRRPRTLTTVDRVLTFFYWTWEIEPHAVMAWIRWRHPDRFEAAARRLAATFDLTLAGYWAVPSAPPWWASEEGGRMDGDVKRVMDAVAASLKGKRRPLRRDHAVGANPFAAMPSDHFASALMTAHLLDEIDRRLGAAGLAYALLLGFALVYLGEHYVVDLLAGAALAAAVDAADRRLSTKRARAGLIDR
jgi:membrane-associated phospholipid phosphatase